MADLRSTLTITGTVNGRAVSITHEFTLVDVYDAGVVDEEGTGASYLGGEVIFNQNNPNYLMFANRDVSGVTQIALTGSGTSVINIPLNPGAIVCLTAAEGTGLILDTTSATSIALEDLQSMESGQPVMATGGVLQYGRINALFAYQATT